MRFAFSKMHGLGNDFVVIDARVAPLALTDAQARGIADRRDGIGCDQVILLEASAGHDARMRIWNADGGEVEACGNAARAVALLLGKAATVETAGGPIRLEPNGAGATVDMGAPRFGWDEIPLAYPVDLATVGWDGLGGGQAINVGNPHVVFFVEDSVAVELARLGPEIEHDPLFPERVNVGVAQVTGPQSLKLRVWERGAGETRACGTGACAAAVAAIRARHCTSPVDVAFASGSLSIAWMPGETISMTGPATLVFTGEADLDAFAA